MAIRIWLANVDDVDIAPARGVFSADELERAAGTPSPRSRHRFLARRWMARALLARVTGDGAAELVLERRCGRCGRMRPASPLGAGPAARWWSASSSGSLAAVAISDVRVGLDLERDEERPRWRRIAERFYTEAEQDALGESAARFLELWTIKEAYLKALGIGLPGGLRSLDCTLLRPDGGGWKTSAAHPGWRFRSLEPAAGFVAAIAVEGATDSIELDRWSGEAGEA